MQLAGVPNVNLIHYRLTVLTGYPNFPTKKLVSFRTIHQRLNDIVHVATHTIDFRIPGDDDAVIFHPSFFSPSRAQ